MMNMQRGMMMYAMILIVTLGGGLAPLMGADIVWTNTTGGVWLEPGNWDPNIVPGATDTAQVTNAFPSYVVQYNTTETDFRGPDAHLHLRNDAPGQTVTLEVNANLGASASANYPRIGLQGNARLVVNGVTMYFGSSPENAATFMYGDWEVNGGNMHFLRGTLIGSLHVKSGGHFANNHNFRTTGNTRIVIEPDARWNLSSGNSLVQLGDTGELGTTTVTNWGRVYITSASGGNFNIGARGNNVNIKTHWWQMDGSSLEILNPNRHLAVGWAQHASSLGESIFYLVGGSVTNRGPLVIGINENTAGSARYANAWVNIWGGNWESEGVWTVIGGFKPTYGHTPHDAGHRSNHFGTLVQTNGTFRSLGNVLVANGPSQGRLEISGGTFTVTNVTENARLVIGAAEFNTITPDPGDGILRLEGGTLRVDRLVATNGAVRSKIEFDGGTLETADTEVDTGAALVVGDGVLDATLNLLGGTHVFADGVSISANAALTVGGPNTIGSATLDGDLTLSEDARLAWAFEDGDPDALTVTGTVTLPASANVELNALDASNPTSIPLMTATGGFTGSPFDWPAVDVGGTAYHFRVQGDTLLAYIPSGTLIIIR